MSIRKRVFGAVLSAIMLVSVTGVGTASAAISKSVGGGTWSYSKEFRMITSQYYHGSENHGSTAKIGSTQVRDCRVKGNWSFARVRGSGTQYAYWHSVCSGHSPY